MQFSFRHFSPRQQKWMMVVVSLFVSLLGSLAVFAIIPSPIRTLVDMTIAYMGNGIPTEGDIVIVAIDDKTIDTFTQTNSKFISLGSEQYTVYSDTLKYLRESGARAVGFDIVFANATSGGAADYFRDQLLTLPSAIGINLGVMIREDCLVTSLAQSYAKSGAGDEECARITDRERQTRQVAPSQIFSGVTLGAVNQSLTFDYALYRASDVQVGDQIYPNLGEALVRQIASGSSMKPNTADRLIYFSAPSGERAYPYYSLSDVHAGVIPREKFKNKIILIGESGTLTQDQVFTPLAPNKKMSGVETHAHYIEARLRGLMEKDLSRASLVLLSIFVSLFLVIGVIFVPRYPLMMIGGGALSIVTAYILSPIIHFAHQVLLPFTWLVIVSIVSFLVSYALRYVLSDREKKYLRNTFARYLDDTVIKVMEKNGELALENSEEDIAVIFSDIESFSSYSEALGTQKIFALMNLYLSTMTEILQSQGATLDKYIGDAVMGFIGAPHRLSAEEACSRALGVIHRWQLALPELNAKLRTQGLLTSLNGEQLPDIRFRVGVSYGQAIVGNIGSKDRVSYTAMGDTVNLASRLEAINKYYSTYLMIADEVYVHLTLQEQERCSLVDCISVKGKEESIKIYEYFPLGKSEQDREFDRVMASYFRSEFHPDNILQWEAFAKKMKKVQFLVEHGHDASKKYGEWDTTKTPPVFHFGEK